MEKVETPLEELYISFQEIESQSPALASLLKYPDWLSKGLVYQRLLLKALDACSDVAGVILLGICVNNPTLLVKLVGHVSAVASIILQSNVLFFDRLVSGKLCAFESV
ncbi:hypothetical protein LOZ57_000618 [Ophidiomyces ophidiicola]|uniref:uncharacterized protein n=1 Tax=Ophidiomyces ophidiicola TaxID=1387563 RepID=UPI0020C309BD|nr:uncharacterized protein LOZ57_000618 [Ophidiomyces ophidiicola]KAI1952540.1 hypothetical protein LOZ57_000618 [Ophidiomyces ophidiicola]